ncbi:MAG TPA: phosphoribosylformylglycinamidine cyclo-ligase [Chthonomonas sp.]|uniref:phosphoribosylformylglycinamidine cyclo-ligase n=1 Tax=Chthonomonas sp. TaxID=2282153 RepID=UPI002B4AD27B|nr:phosphoribosylformylglycinamidine cyclo-ligase [Chthonomonas sp.]HLI48561.1 phosphoribosylformylglycinamidine cyclo-ligase [Chthonomonas sp.]
MSDLRLTYRDAGVDIDAANEAVHRMREHVRSTFTPQVLTDIGSFGGMFALSGIEGYTDPVLVSSIDGVGTKVKIAAQLGSHSSIGQDLVNHCVNDILVQGARPLFFLDYFGTGRLVPVVAEEIIRGLSEACKAIGCALIGGETAEMPGLYPEGEYDLVGCIVGIVDRHRIIDGTKVAPGDTVIGLASNGLHTNGFSLARKALLEGPEPLSLYEHIPCLGRTLGEELLAIHRCYAPSVLPLLTSFDIHAMAHITGGGFYENIPRVVPPDCSITIDRRSWNVPPIFTLIQEKGGVPEPEMYRTFNMGIGMVLIVPPEQAPLIVNCLNEAGEVASIIGDIRQGVHEVIII